MWRGPLAYGHATAFKMLDMRASLSPRGVSLTLGGVHPVEVVPAAVFEKKAAALPKPAAFVFRCELDDALRIPRLPVLGAVDGEAEPFRVILYWPLRVRKPT